MLLLTAVVANGQSIKEFTIGEKAEKDYEITTVGGIKGMLFPSTLEDGTIVSIIFVTEGFTKLYEWEVENFASAVEEKYHISLRELPNQEDEGYTLIAHSKKCRYLLKVDYYEFFGRPYEIMFGITNMKLFEKQKAEEERKSQSDF